MNVHKTGIALVLAAASLLMACAADSAPVSESEDEVRTRKIDAAEAQALFDAVDNNCAGNDNGHFRRFDARAFDASSIMAKVRDDDRDAMGVGCSGDHGYSMSKESAVEMFTKHLDANEWDDTTCIKEHLSTAQIGRLRKLVADPTNLGVFASVYDGHGDGNSEACAYYTFHVYRADGVQVTLTFNHTD
jgi:hypothetical protein